MQDPVVVMVDTVQGKGGSRRRDRRKHDQRNHQRTARFGAFPSSRYESSRHYDGIIASVEITSGAVEKVRIFQEEL
jgi:hypothetical protein